MILQTKGARKNARGFIIRMTNESNSNDLQLSKPIQIIRTQRGKRKLLLDGYIYRLDRLNDRGIEQWRCSKKNCRGRIHLPSVERTNITLISSHSHLPEPAQCEAAILVDHIRTSAQDNLHQSPKEIITRLLRSATDEAAANLPSMTAMQRSIQRRRQQHKSSEIFSTNTESSLIDQIEIFHCSIDDHSLSSLMKLGSNQILVLNCGNELRLSNASIWLCTSFNEMKTDLLQCILIIQIFDDDHQRFIPIIYAFLPLNRHDFYQKLFDQFFSSQTPRYILTNCDQILIESLNQFFRTYSIIPQIKISPIFLHNDLHNFHQSFNRSGKAEEDKFIKYLLALVYIPQKDVINTFETLQEIGLTTVQGVYDRFEDLCLGRLRRNGQRSSAIFPMKIWNWSANLSDFENLSLINTSIQQWDELFRTSLLVCSHRNLSKIICTIQQLNQHHIKSTSQTKQSDSLEEYLLSLIDSLPIEYMH